MKSLMENQGINDRIYINMNFLTLVKNRKEESAERGAVYKSITICSLLYEDLSIFKKYLEEIVEDFLGSKIMNDNKKLYCEDF